MYYRIIDFTTSKTSSASTKTFTKEEISKYVGIYKSHINIQTEVSSNVKGFLKGIETLN